MHIQLRYFASFAEAAGKASESLAIESDLAASLYAALAERYGFRLPIQRVRLAVNDQFVSWEHRLRDGDTVVFIPPVSGG